MFFSEALYLVVENTRRVECWSNFVKLDYNVKKIRLIEKTINIDKCCIFACLDVRLEINSKTRYAGCCKNSQAGRSQVV